MISDSVNASSFTLMAGADTVNGVVTYDLSTLTAIFTLDSNLSLSTIYTSTITTDVKDLDGNQMTDNYTWNFRTSPDIVVATIDVGRGPYGVAVTPNGSYAYIAKGYADAVSVIQPSDNTVIATINVGDGPYGIAVTPDGSYVYVTNINDDTVSVIQISDKTVVATINVGNYPYGVTVTPDGSHVYVTNANDNTISVIGF